jgi:hypothetical protein
LNALGAFVTKYNDADSKGNNDFEKRREAWGIQCAWDKTLRAIDLRMVMALQSFLNRESFAAFPSTPPTLPESDLPIPSINTASRHSKH